MNRIYLGEKFRTDTPVLQDVTLVNVWGVWDGPLFGVCKVNGQKLFFLDLVESIWRFYSEKSYDRLWRIYGVYDMPIKDCKAAMKKTPARSSWQDTIVDESDCIGIFWDYK